MGNLTAALSIRFRLVGDGTEGVSAVCVEGDQLGMKGQSDPGERGLGVFPSFVPSPSKEHRQGIGMWK